MKGLLAVFAVFSLVEAAPSPSIGFVENVPRTRIMYGPRSEPGQFPHQLAMIRVTAHNIVCGAVLVAADTALTAAHCVDPGYPENYSLRAGLIDMDDFVSEHEVARTEIHEDYAYDYASGSFQQDIAVLHLASPVDLDNELIDTIRIARAADGDFTGEICQISGWGPNGAMPDPPYMGYANITVIENNECQELIDGATGDREVLDNQICVFNDYNAACRYDSGGPLTCGDRLAGLISWAIEGASICIVAYPSVSTRVNSFEDWIDEHVPGLP